MSRKRCRDLRGARTHVRERLAVLLLWRTSQTPGCVAGTASSDRISLATYGLDRPSSPVLHERERLGIEIECDELDDLPNVCHDVDAGFLYECFGPRLTRNEVLEE